MKISVFSLYSVSLARACDNRLQLIAKVWHAQEFRCQWASERRRETFKASNSIFFFLRFINEMCPPWFLARLIACRSPTLQSKQREKKWKITVMAFGRGASERYHRFTASCGVIKWTPRVVSCDTPKWMSTVVIPRAAIFFIRQSQFASAKVCAVYAFVSSSHSYI